VPTKSIERPRRASKPASRAFHELSREPRLANARLAGDEDGCAPARLRCFERMPESSQLACASYERSFLTGLHAASIARLAPGEQALVSIPLPADR